MPQSLYRHFQFTYEDLKEQIEKKKSQIFYLKDLLKQDISPAQNLKKIKKLENELKDLENEDIFINFNENDIKCLQNYFEITKENYILLDSTIEKVIFLFSSLFNSISTSKINKKIDQWNHSDNTNAKRRFIEFYPHEPSEYMKALKSRNTNRISNSYTNQRNEDKIQSLNTFYADTDLLTVQKNLETLVTQRPSEDDIKQEVKILIADKFQNILKEEYRNELSKLIAKEIILRLSDSKKGAYTLQEEIEVLSESLDSLKSKHFLSQLRKLRRKGLTTPEEIWNNII
jgi:hypothetical protein